MANVMGFLRFVKQIAKQRGIAADTLSFRPALRGIKETSLECITRRLTRGLGAVVAGA